MNYRGDRIGESAAVIAFFCLALGGCASKLERGHVTGVVRHGNQPLENVKVVFVPSENRGQKVSRAEGVTDAQGRFELQNEDDDEGPVVGLYTVIVEDLALYTAPRSPNGTLIKKPPARYPSKYQKLLESPLRQEIHPGAQTIDIDLP
ncbi:MAG TPA: hypothetical protein VGP68_15925 [Gemmataceae bacterium]|jgi:hypothetical protein|nr:hypothetical protein [Gemmataceae bacterium]